VTVTRAVRVTGWPSSTSDTGFTVAVVFTFAAVSVSEPAIGAELPLL